ncbi:unnamed protein product [Brachionus calyciflorus]|uniref:Ubiquitin carboxyl-terminal hydrolase n=1 Tax=Brachionus calyciflorus TaxID=104777 RepID=A0A813V9W3_9BILA|nr:unnamed protein product [Brachionus calyciflorus]
MTSYYTISRTGAPSRGRTESPAPQRTPFPNTSTILPSSKHNSKCPPLTYHRFLPSPQNGKASILSNYDNYYKSPGTLSANLTPIPYSSNRSTSVSTNRTLQNQTARIISPDLTGKYTTIANSPDLNSVKLKSFSKNEPITRKTYETDFNLDPKPFVRSSSNTQYYTIKNNTNTSTSTASVSTSSSSSTSSQSTRNNYDNTILVKNNLNNNNISSYGAKNENTNEINVLSQRGNVGLRNLGNTCFMNSILQCLSNTKFLLEYILNSSYTNDINKTLSTMRGSLFISYAELIKKMWKGADTFVNPQEFRYQLIKYSPNFSGYAQQDAEEFLTYLIKGLHEDVNLVKTKPPSYSIDDKTWDAMNDFEKSEAHWMLNFRGEKSKISDMFVGQLKSTLMCTKCEFRSPTFELFWDLAVPIPTKNPSIKLDDCIKLFMTEEILDGDNKPVCSNCKEKRRCAKRYTIEKLPKILVIHLKRFLRARFNNKINLNVDYPIEGLDMSKYLSCNVDPKSTSNRNNFNCIYDLYGISLHSGTESSGHYVAYCKNPYNKKWYCFNDQSVREISVSSLQDSNAYILFYQLRS